MSYYHIMLHRIFSVSGRLLPLKRPLDIMMLYHGVNLNPIKLIIFYGFLSMTQKLIYIHNTQTVHDKSVGRTRNRD